MILENKQKKYLKKKIIKIFLNLKGWITELSTPGFSIKT